MTQHATTDPAPNPLAPAWLDVPPDADALDPRIWPANAVRDDTGALLLGGVPASTIAQRFGTPVLVIDAADAKRRAADVVGAFTRAAGEAGVAAHVYYAGKAFLSAEVARWMRAAGARIDVCSAGELALALRAGVEPQAIGLHGNNKSWSELDAATAAGIGAVVVDSLPEIADVAAAAERNGRVQPVRIRVNSGVHAHTHEYLATAREDQKFGIPLAGVAEAAALIRARPSLRLLGLHSHIGSQIFEAAGFEEAAGRLLAVHRDLLEHGPVPELNLGGGFGIAYTAADDPRPIAEIASGLVSAVVRACRRLGIPVPDLAVEPGRSIIGPAGVTLYRAGVVKDVEVAIEAGGSALRRYIAVDGGMSDNVRPALYGADYQVRLANRAGGGAAVLVRIAGKHCESGDIVVHADYLPADAGAGDLLAVPATGAYCHSLASNYNLLPRPAVVQVEGGEVRVLVRGETIDDLLARDAGLDPAADDPGEGLASEERTGR